MASKTKKQSAFPPVEGRPGFVAVPWTSKDGTHSIATDNGNRVLASFEGITVPFPASRKALQDLCAGFSYTLPGGEVVTGVEAVAAGRVKHMFESVRGDARSRLLSGEEIDAETYQTMVNLYDPATGGGIRTAKIDEATFRKASAEEQVAILRAKGIPESVARAMAAGLAK